MAMVVLVARTTNPILNRLILFRSTVVKAMSAGIKPYSNQD